MSQPPVCYEHILRAIGQGLESLSLDAFDLEVTNDICSIQGTPTQKESEEPTVPKLNAFKKAFLGIVTARKQPRHPPVLPKGLLGRLPRSYCNLRMPTLTSSNETDRRYAQMGAQPPIIQLAEVLRTVGLVC
jgi:hypothetical protein